MFSNFNKVFSYIFTFILLICILFIPIIYISEFSLGVNSNDWIPPSYINQDKFVWPIPGYTSISSYFGKRNSPTAGASTHHSGLDIPAPEGTYIYAIDDGYVSFASWGAGGGYTIVIELSNYPNMAISYCHVSSSMFVERGEMVSKNEIIGMVGPKNVYGIINNPYKDSDGKPTNGATTGSHLHFTIKENGIPVNPLDYY